MAAGSINSRSNADDDLILYHLDMSFYSQKARLALAVKGLPYQKQPVFFADPFQENLEPWFLHLTPLGEVPVLVHNGKVVTDSTRIIDHLDSVFHDKGPRLAPPEDTDLGRRVRHFRDMLDELPVDLYTYGPFYHPELANGSQLPAPLRAARSINVSRVKRLHELADTHPDLKEVYLGKTTRLERRMRQCEDRDFIEKPLGDLEVTLDEVEKELGERKQEQEASGQHQWLCGESFTAADVMLSCLLHRLSWVGLIHRFLQKRPLLAAYYLAAKAFGPFKSEVSSCNNDLYMFIRNVPSARWRKMGPKLVVMAAMITMVAAVLAMVFEY